MVVALLLAHSPAKAEWRRAVTTHFIIYSEASDENLRASADRLERFDGLLRRLTPVPPSETERRLIVYMTGSVGQLQQLIGNDRAYGFYVPHLTGPFAVVPRRTGDEYFEADVVLFHEYVHHFMLQHFSVAYPGWFVEGYAEFFSNTRFERDGSIVLGSFADHRGFALRADPPPLAEIMLPNRRRMDPGIFYAHAWALTHYLLISDERQGQLQRYLALVGGGRPPLLAIDEAFGGMAALQRDYRRYRAASRIPTLILRFDQAPQPGPIRIEALDPVEERLLWLRLERLREPDGILRDGLLRRVRTRVAQSPTDPAALQLLADTEALVGNFPAATRAVDILLAARPQAPRALLRKGLIELALLERDRVTDHARWVAAREWLRRANLAGSDDALALYEYYRAFEREGVQAPPPAVAALERAYELVPQSFDLRQRFARELVRARRHQFAVNVLSPIAYSAHGGWRSEAAQRVIDLIRPLQDGAEPPAGALVLPAQPADDR
jgi:hypothetical protein